MTAQHLKVLLPEILKLKCRFYTCTQLPWWLFPTSVLHPKQTEPGFWTPVLNKNFRVRSLWAAAPIPPEQTLPPPEFLSLYWFQLNLSRAQSLAAIFFCFENFFNNLVVFYEDSSIFHQSGLPLSPLEPFGPWGPGVPGSPGSPASPFSPLGPVKSTKLHQ